MNSPRNIRNIVSQIDNKYSLAQRINSLPQMIKATFKKTWHGASRAKILLSFAGLLYVISPIDFIPELILGPFGLADDMVVIALCLMYLIKKTDDYISDTTKPTTIPGTLTEIDNLERNR